MLKRTNEEGRQSLWGFPRPEITWIFPKISENFWSREIPVWWFPDPILKLNNSRTASPITAIYISFSSILNALSYEINLFSRCSSRNYNIPRACLLNRSPVPAMDLKRNKSGLWRHKLETCRRLRWLCRKHSNNVARHDKTLAKSTFLSRDMSSMSRSSDIMLWLLYIKKLQYMHFQFDYFCVAVTLCCDFYTLRSCNTCTFSLTTFAVLRNTT